MPAKHVIRADYDRQSIVVYQAYPPEIVDAALAAQRFVPPFSMERMTWIKPSFLWLMERSNWGRKAGQERILAVRITRTGWEEALGAGVLTSAEPRVYGDHADWKKQFREAKVYIQWDPERSLRGVSLPYRSIQVGLSRHIVPQYVNEWIISIEDYTPRVHKMATLLKVGEEARSRALLPSENVYPLSEKLKQRLDAS